MAAASRPVTAQFQNSWNRIKLVLELKMWYYYLLTEEELEAESNLYRVTELIHGLVHASVASCFDDGALLRHCHLHEYYCVAWKLIVTQTSLPEGFHFYTVVPIQQTTPEHAKLGLRTSICRVQSLMQTSYDIKEPLREPGVALRIRQHSNQGIQRKGARGKADVALPG